MDREEMESVILTSYADVLDWLQEHGVQPCEGACGHCAPPVDSRASFAELANLVTPFNMRVFLNGFAMCVQDINVQNTKGCVVGKIKFFLSCKGDFGVIFGGRAGLLELVICPDSPSEYRLCYEVSFDSYSFGADIRDDNAISVLATFSGHAFA